MQMKRKKEAEDQSVPETSAPSNTSSPAKCSKPVSSEALGRDQHSHQQHAVLHTPQADTKTPASKSQVSSEVRRRKLLAPPSAGKRLCAIAVGSSEVQHSTQAHLSLRTPTTTRSSPRLTACSSASRDSKTELSEGDSHFPACDSASKDRKTQPSGVDSHYTDSDSTSSLAKPAVLGRPTRVRSAIDAIEKAVEEGSGRKSPQGMMTRRRLSLTKRKSDQHETELGISASKLPKIAEPGQKGRLAFFCPSL